MKFEPVRFSKLVRVSKPAPPVSWASDAARLTVTAPAAVGIAGGVAAGGPAVHDVVAGAPDQGVVAGPTQQIVVAGTAVQRVIAGAAVEDIGIGIAREGVVEGRSRQVLDADQRVDAGADGVLRRRNGEADGDAAGGTDIAGGVAVAVAAVQRVVAGAAVQRVGAVETLRTLSPALPVRVSSKKDEPMMFSILARVSVPAPPVCALTAPG